MNIDDFDDYSRVVGADEAVYIVIFELPARKLLCVKLTDVHGGADVANVVVMEKPA